MECTSSSKLEVGTGVTYREVCVIIENRQGGYIKSIAIETSNLQPKICRTVPKTASTWIEEMMLMCS